MNESLETEGGPRYTVPCTIDPGHGAWRDGRSAFREKQHLPAPVHIGDVVKANIAGAGADMVATKDVG